MRFGRRTTTAAVLTAVLTLGLGAGAQAPRQPAISQDDLRGWLTYISSDALQGRQVFTEGLGLAGSYIADHLKEWGVTPLGDNGTYFQEVRVLGARTRSNSSVTVTVNGQSRTFKDGEGVTFSRFQGGKQTLSGKAVFAGYGVTFAPLEADDYKGRNVEGSVVLFLGRTGPKGFTDAQSRILGGRAREATTVHHAIAAIGPAGPPRPPAGGNNSNRADFTTTQRLDAPNPPQITANDEFFAFVFSASGTKYEALKEAADKQEPLPDVALPGVSIRINVDAEYDVVQTRLTRNVVGMVPGSDARLKDSYVMLGAHYDHIGYEQFGVNERLNAIETCAGQSRPQAKPDDIVDNGADDDGSGTVALMALAKAFAQGPRPKRSLVFVWHTGEEAGLYGSRYMADHAVVPLRNVAAQLNIDMIGRNQCDDPAQANTLFLVGSDRISTELHNINEDANASLPSPLTLDYSYNDAADVETLYTRSDHYSYASKGIPIIFFTTGLHRDYHYVTDEVGKIIFPKMLRVTTLVYNTATRVGNLDHLPARDNLGARTGRGHSGKLAQR